VEALLAPVLLISGFVAGSFVTTQMMRWGTLLWVSTTTHGGDFLGPPKRRLLWVLPFAALLHPAPYVAASVVFLTVATLRGKIGLIWLWLLGGTYVYVAFSGLVLFRAYRLQRRRRITAGPNSRSSGRDA
jgi:hypothetical protein